MQKVNSKTVRDYSIVILIIAVIWFFRKKIAGYITLLNLGQGNYGGNLPNNMTDEQLGDTAHTLISCYGYTQDNETLFLETLKTIKYQSDYQKVIALVNYFLQDSWIGQIMLPNWSTLVNTVIDDDNLKDKFNEITSSYI